MRVSACVCVFIEAFGVFGGGKGCENKRTLSLPICQNQSLLTKYKSATKSARTGMAKKFDLKTEVLLALTKIIAIAVVAMACGVAVYYCTHIYYDREAALHDALVCTQSRLAAKKAVSWITNGTLLGAVRLQRFVMWDGEIDVAVLNDGLTAQQMDTVISAVETACFPYSSSLQSTGAGEPRRWRLCTKRICAEIHEFLPWTVQPGYLWSIDGVAPSDQILPLSSCTVEGIVASCPVNSSYFLDSAYGPEWRSGSLTSLFF